ncbi:hypothetical protein [Pseudomonas quasicaspiana]|uniref:hypothetical protein n=1 Tax=Pseudomonas quasicaspiana TaxID=2829821 RepID=UPI001E2C9479|nr:hypothetical protein [Pseudomonas quasicaspiana]MCD5969943.1 hypothetical protein [Pseudomonas quasicaspiana]
MTITLKYNFIFGAEAVSPAEKACPSWPPPDDFPVTLDTSGNTVSFFGDSTWKFKSNHDRDVNLNFKRIESHRLFIDPTNEKLFKTILAWWLWRCPSAISVSSIQSRAGYLSKIFIRCTQSGISAADLYKHARVTDHLKTESAYYLKKTLPLLHLIYENRGSIGFYILPPLGIERFYGLASPPESKQTPYIPPRIWNYQVTRLKEFIDDYHAAKAGVNGLYKECLDLYLEYYGSWDYAFAPIKARKRRSTPFDSRDGVRFDDLARKHGVELTLQKWLYGSGVSLMGPGKGLNGLNRYLGMASRVGIAYILNFTTMRIDEAWSLRRDCLKKEMDPDFGEFWVLAGETTKLFRDSDARWITSPSVEPAIQMMVEISHLRESAAKVNPNIPDDLNSDQSHYLILRSFEPWSAPVEKSLSALIHYDSYGSLSRYYPELFDDDQLRLTTDDISVARFITPSLDDEKYKINKPWLFAWHQLRRTGAVNMQASGLVSLSSLQYAMKHQSRFQSLYYAQGFSKLIFNEDSRNEYIKAAYDTRAIKLMELAEKRFTSPYGEGRRDTLIAPITSSDRKKLLEAAKKGMFVLREVLLGVCLNKEHCTKGGIDNIVYCGGGHGKGACVDLLFDKAKLTQVKQLKAEAELLLETAQNPSPYHASLCAQVKAAENAILAMELP